jgi:hypothetical protein
MKKIVAKDCPLCVAKAEYYFVDSDNLKYFKCPSCTYFQISNQAEQVLNRAAQEWRDNCAEKARDTPTSNLLVIVVPPLSTESDVLSAVISAEYRPKSECSL